MGKINDRFVQRKPIDDQPSTRHVDITIRCYEDGPLAVLGPIEEKEFILAALHNAIDAVNNHHSRRPIVVPGRNVVLPPLPGIVKP
jgi:hypothetical protein